MSDPLDRLADDLEALAERPLLEHPEALETAHRTLVGELDVLAGGPPAATQP